MNFTLLREASGSAVERLMQAVDASAGAPALIRDVDALCLHFHIIATATLLVDGNPQVFFLNLCRAAENWRRLLVYLRSRNLQLPSSKENTALLGAVAAGHWELARQVVELSETRWCSDEEYRSEHAWAQLLHRLIEPSTHVGESDDTLLQYLEEAGDDESNDRSALARAIQARDEHAFTKAFKHAVLVRNEVIEKRAKIFTTPTTRFAPHRYIWIEGLALLRLAERCGLQLHEEHYLYCPPLARTPMLVSYQGDWAISLAA